MFRNVYHALGFIGKCNAMAHESFIFVPFDVTFTDVKVLVKCSPLSMMVDDNLRCGKWFFLGKLISTYSVQ